jgi:hypothetical protein
LTSIEDRVDVMLALGGHHQAVAQLAGLIREHPLRERFRGQFRMALYRCGRQADASRGNLPSGNPRRERLSGH